MGITVSDTRRENEITRFFPNKVFRALGGTLPKDITAALGLWEGLSHSASLRSIVIVLKSHSALLRSIVIVLVDVAAKTNW